MPMSAAMPEPEDEYVVERHRRRAARERYLTELFGAEEWQDRVAPQPVEDMDSLLGEHAAQLRNAARYLMNEALSDSRSVVENARAATTVCSLARTNVMIARALREDAEKNRKTVHGVAVTVEPQD
jgi:hypothetical protein